MTLDKWYMTGVRAHKRYTRDALLHVAKMPWHVYVYIFQHLVRSYLTSISPVSRQYLASILDSSQYLASISAVSHLTKLKYISSITPELIQILT